MKNECTDFPKLNHKNCQLEPHEKVTADYFESRGLSVERLCAVKSEISEKAPDFRFTDTDNAVYVCEVKKPESSMGSLTKPDEKYLDRAQFEKLVEEARRQNTTAAVTEEEWNFYNNRIPYPDEERNTDLKEKENTKKLKKWLKESSIGKSPVAVTISRNDSFHWTDEELHNFADYLVDSLRLIEKGQVPSYWSKDLHTLNGYYRKARDNGRYIQNQIQVIRTDRRFLVDIQYSLGINWEAIEANSRQAQKQIKSQLQREPDPEKIIRLLVMFLEQDIYFQYFSEINKFEMDVNRRILQKFPEISAVAFCTQPFSAINFMVFHTSNKNIPSLPKNIFNDGYSLQFPN
jgi:hypothetical protein